MVEFVTPRSVPTARAAGHVSDAGSRALNDLSAAVGQVANNFTEFYEKKAAIEGDRLLAEIQEEWSRGYNERAKTAGAGFAASTLESYDEFVESKISDYRTRMADSGMANVPERNMEDIRLALDKYRLKLETRALQREAAARAAAAAAARADTVRMRANAILSDPSLAEEAIENAPDEASRKAYIDAYLNAELLGENYEAVSDMLGSGRFDADLSPSKKLSFLKATESGLESLESERRVEARAAQDVFEADLAEGIAYAERFGTVPSNLVPDEEAFDTLYADDPERGRATREAYEADLDYAFALNDVAMAPPQQIENEVARLSAKLEEPGNTPEDARRLDTYLSAAQSRNAALAEDAAGFVTRQDETVGELLGLVSEAMGDEESDPGAVTASYVSGLNSVYDRLGVPEAMRTVMPKEMAERTVAMLSDVGSDVAAQTLAGIRAQWGGASGMVIAQLQRAGLAPEYVTALRFADDPVLAQKIVNLAGVKRTDLTEGLEATEVKSMDAEFTDGLAEYMEAFEAAQGPQAIATMNEARGVAEKLALTYMRTGTAPDVAAIRAMSELFPETPVVSGRFSILLPKGVRERTALSVLEDSMEEDALLGAGIEPIDDVRFPEFADLAVTAAAAQSSGLWINNATGDGFQLMVKVDGLYIPLLLENGKPYQVFFDEIERAPAKPRNVPVGPGPRE